MGINCKNSYFSLCCQDLFNSWFKIDNITSEYLRSEILCTIKKSLTWNRKSATEGVPLRYYSLKVSIYRGLNS